jgi:hypothetical protein
MKTAQKIVRVGYVSLARKVKPRRVIFPLKDRAARS